MQTPASDPPVPPPPLAPVTPPQLVLSPYVDPPLEKPKVENRPKAEVAVKRKRGRPPKNEGTKKRKKGKEEEEVCFICFDGGDLVVCDCRSCPKVYHPFCVNRDPSFFRSRGRWNCGWHICSTCTKAASYMCYTCTYSLCKVCIKNAKFSCIRENKGLCETCLKIVMLIESNGHFNGEKVVVDFDDKNSWEYLFKLYWLAVKKKLTITSEELNNARNPHKGSGFAKHDVNSSKELYVVNGRQEASSGSSLGNHEGSNFLRGEPKKQTRELAIGEGPNRPVGKSSDSKSLDKKSISEPKSILEDGVWASQKLLKFVSHMKHGDISALTLSAVQELLLKYVEENNLRDPHNKNKIICDKMLLNLFAKTRVEMFEMQNLIESHFLTSVASKSVGSHGGIPGPCFASMDTTENCDVAATCPDKKRKNQSNVDDFAAINIHNINLIYLRQNLFEDLLDDMNVFREKVIGSFVRMRVPSTAENQDMYRLVPVVGTQTVAEKYDVGKKTIDVGLEVMNLNKTEVLPINAISNEDFTEEECKQLKQSMKCGLIKKLKVGAVQEKAKDFQAARVNDWFEREKLRLGHLRDRASETGCTEELRIYGEKLQFLNSPEERIRMLNEVQEIHGDPHMNTNCDSSDEETKQMKKGAKELVFLGTAGPDASHNLSGTENQSNCSLWQGSLKSVNILVSLSSNDSALSRDRSTLEENVATSSEVLEKLRDGNVVHRQDSGHSKCASSAACPGYISPGLQDGVNQGLIVENRTSDAGSAGRGLDTEKCDSSTLCLQSRETCSDSELQLTLVPIGQCSDALNPPYSALESNNRGVMSVQNLAGIFATSTITVHSLVSSSDVTQSAEVAQNELPLGRPNKSDAGKVTKAHETSSREGSNPSSTPSCELQQHSRVHDNEPDVKLTETQEIFGGERAMVSALCSEHAQGNICTAAEGKADVLHAEGEGLSSLDLHEKKQVSLTAKDEEMSNHCAMASPPSESEKIKSVSVLESPSLCHKPNSELPELPTSSQKSNPEDSKPDPPSSGATPEKNKIWKPEPILIPDQMRLSKLKDETDTRIIDWSLLSPTPTSKPPDWDIVADTMSGNNQNRPFLYSDSLMTSKASTDSFVLVIPVSNSDDEDTLSKCLEEALQTIEEDRGPTAANEEVQGKQVKPDINVGWGAPSLGSINLDWEPLSPANAYASEGWGAFLQGSTTAEWGALSPVQSNANAGLELFSPVHPNAGWGVPSSSQSNSNACLGAPFQGNINLNVGWGESISGNTFPIWGPSSPQRPTTFEMLGGNINLNLDTRQRGYQNVDYGGSELRSGASRVFLGGDFGSTCSTQDGDKNSEQGSSSFGGARISRTGYYPGNGGSFSQLSDRGQGKR